MRSWGRPASRRAVVSSAIMTANSHPSTPVPNASKVAGSSRTNAVECAINRSVAPAGRRSSVASSARRLAKDCWRCHASKDNRSSSKEATAAHRSITTAARAAHRFWWARNAATASVHSSNSNCTASNFEPTISPPALKVAAPESGCGVLLPPTVPACGLLGRGSGGSARYPAVSVLRDSMEGRTSPAISSATAAVVNESSSS